MQEPNSFIYDEYEVYNLDDLINFDQAYFYGCLHRKRDVLRKRNITENDYFYAKITRNGWVKSHENYSRVKILVKAEWVKSNVTKFLDIYGHSSKHTIVNPQTSPTKVDLNKSMILREAPPILELEKHEKFQDDVYIYKVEVRGIRKEDKIYFKGTDIQTIFEMEDDFIKNIKKEHTKYVSLEDYEIFLIKEKTKRVKKIFLTYNGLLKVIFRSNSKTAYRFRKWATKIIYTAHLGTDEQRFDQALDIASVNASLVKQVFDTCVTKVPCVYLFCIGRVSKMFKHYPELKPFRSGFVCKFGMTISLHRRLIEHIKNYGCLNGSELKLSQWSPINEKFISKAETQISRYFKEKKISFQGHDEIVILSRTDLTNVKAIYLEVYNTFGIVTEMVKVLAKNDALVNHCSYQKLMLEEKDKHIKTLNRQIELYQEREQEWINEKKEWINREKKLLKVIEKLLKE